MLPAGLLGFLTIMCAKNGAWVGSRFKEMGAVVLIFFLVSRAGVDVCLCGGVTEFTEYQEYLYPDGSFQNSGDRVSWLLVLDVLALLSAQRSGEWLYDDCPKSSRIFRNRLKNVPSLREALHMAGTWDGRDFTHRLTMVFSGSLVYVLLVLCVPAVLLHESHFSSGDPSSLFCVIVREEPSGSQVVFLFFHACFQEGS